MEFNLLGPFEVVRDGRPITLSALKPRTMLAMLVLQAGRTVPWERILEELWNDEPPPSALANLHGYASRLRYDVFDGDTGRIVSDSAGCRLVPELDVVDLVEFERLVAVARRAPSADEAIRAYEEAMALWRGNPLVDVAAGPMMSAMATALSERHASAREDYVELRIHQEADLAGVIGDLRRHVATYPARERPRRQLMLALHRAEDSAAALEVYADTRAYFRDELGMDPSHRLQQLQGAILRREEPPAPFAIGRPLRSGRAQLAVLGVGLDRGTAEELGAALADRGAIALCCDDAVYEAVERHGGIAVRLTDVASTVSAADAVLGLDDSWQTRAGVALAEQEPAVRVVVLTKSDRQWGVETARTPAEAVRSVLP